MLNDLHLQLKTKIIGKKILFADELDSTNDEAKKLACAGPSEGTVVIANSQRKGKGRLGRSWASQKGKGIYVSIVIKPYIDLIKLPLITYFSSIAAVRSINGLTKLNARIKWPNDIVIEGRKVGGILTEAVECRKHGKAVVVGIGINVNNSIASLPQSLKKTATSLKFETGGSVDINKLTKLLLEEFDKLYRAFLQKKFADIIEEWVSNSQTVGEWVTIKVGRREIEGLAENIGPSGELNIRTAGGRIKKVYSGDIASVTEAHLR